MGDFNPVKIVKNTVKAIGNAVKSVVNAVVNVVASVVNFVASPFMGLLGGMPSMPDANAQAQQQQGVLFQRQGSTEQIPVVYGLRKVGGVVTFAETGSDSNKYLWVAYVFAEGCVEGLHEMFIDDFQLSTDTITKLNGGQIVDLTARDGRYDGRCQLQWFPGQLCIGGNGSQIGSNSICKAAPSWKNTMDYNGLAVLFARYEWRPIVTQDDSKANPYSGAIPQVQATIMGRKVISLLATASPDPSALNYDPSSGYRGTYERYSTNPAECLLDYLRNPRYGKGLKNSDIDWDSFRKAAAKFNQTIQYTSAISGPILTTNVVLSTNQTLFQNIKLLLQNSRSYLPYIQGKYKLKVEDAGNDTDITSGVATIAATFTRDNIQGNVQYTGIERSNKYSHVELTWVDPDQKYSTQVVVYPETETERQTYVTQDGGRENSLAATFPAITNRQMALDMARLLFYKSRYQETCALKVSSQAFELEPGDCIRIQANILSFGTTPWRIVNITLNDDYTFNLSCVRNPDWLYPYTKAGEADYVLPPFRPIGSQTILPSFSTPVPVGLLPPNYSIQNTTGSTNTTTNPPPTVINTSTNGGGVGGSTSTVISVPPTVTVLSDAVNFNKAVVTPVTSDTVTIEVTWLQPDHPQYDSIDLYYKGAIEATYRLQNINTKAGSGREISFKTGTLISTAGYEKYEFVARVKYSTGDYSSKTSEISVNVSGITGVTTTDPIEYFSTTYAGWALPVGNTTPGATTLRNDLFGTVDIRPTVTSGTTLTDPRGLKLNLRQRFTRDNPINDQIVGVEVFYKASNTQYWRERRLVSANFMAGDDFTVTLGGPSDTSTLLGSPGGYSTYDFILRPLYIDGTASTWQNRVMGVNIANAGYNIAAAVLGIIEPRTVYPFVTFEQAVQSGAIIDPRDAKIGVKSIQDSYSASGETVPAPMMRVFVNPPDVSIRDSFRGFKVYLRPIQPGIEATVTSFINKTSTLNGDGGTTQYFDIPLTNIGYNQDFEMIVVPLMSYDGVTEEGNYCMYGSGFVNASYTSQLYPSDGNWATFFNFKETATAEALNLVDDFIPQTAPRINITGWYVNRLSNVEVSAGWYQATANSSTPIIDQRYTLKYSVAHIVNYEGLDIYRRRYQSTSQPSTANPYYNFSRWEKVQVNTTGTGTLEVALRVGTSPFEFDYYKAYTDPNYRRPFTSSTVTGNGSGSTGDRVSRDNGYVFIEPQASSGDEFLFVVRADGVVSTQGIWLGGGPYTSTTAGTQSLMANAVGLIVDTAIFNKDSAGNTVSDGWLKKLSEARTVVASAKLCSTNPGRIPVTDVNGLLKSGGAVQLTGTAV